jgi:putative peptide zinc metalloprotease protein
MLQLRPTFSESWYRVVNLKARLRPSAQISRQYYRGERWYVVRDPADNQYHRLSDAAYRFVGLLDGTRTVSEAWELVGGQLADDAPTQNEVIQILSQLHAANLVESNVTPDAAVLLRRHKKMVTRQWQGRLMNILFPRIPLWDPDRFLCRWMPVMRLFLSWGGAILWLLVVGLAIFAIAPEWPRLQRAASDSMDPTNWPFLWASFVLIKLIHELGHGFTCRRFGGECHELGVMFLVLVPAPYVDASSAWSFPNKWAKILVGAGGMIFELFVAALMAFVWLNTRDGTLTNQLAYNVMLIASVSTVIFNANPLLRYDGYYMLSDYLEIPNLRMRATEYTMGLIKRHLFKVKSPQPLPPVGQRFWLFFYAITSTIYRTFVGVMIILMVWNEVPVLGTLMAIGGVITWLLVPVVKTSKYLLIEPELHRKRPRAIAWTLAGVATAVVLIGLIPFKQYIEATGIVEPAQKRIVHAEQSGLVDRIVAKDGQILRGPKFDTSGRIVEPGDVILVCRDRELESSLKQTELLLQAEEARYQDALSRQDTKSNITADEALTKMAVYRKQLDEFRRRNDALTIRAPIDGMLIAPQIHELASRYLKQGEEVARVASMDDLRITALVDQDDAAMLFKDKGSEAEVRLAGQKTGGSYPLADNVGLLNKDRTPVPFTKLSQDMLSMGFAGGGEAETDPSDPEGRQLMRPQFGVWVDLPNKDHRYLPGQRAYLRFTMAKKEPLIQQWGRRFWQLIQANSQSKWT